MKRIRGGSGVGDAIYVRPFVEHFIGLGERVEVCSDYPEVFMGTGATVSKHRRHGIDVLAHYTAGKAKPGTTQWDDVCASAGTKLSFRINWQRRNAALVAELRHKAAGRPLILVHGGRTPMGRTDGFGAELLPDRRAFVAVLDAMRDCYTVRVGKGPDLYPLPVSLDLNGRTSISDLLDLAQDCDGVIGQCSLAVPLAEVFDKYLVAVWSARGMERGKSAYIRQIRPEKVLSKPTSSFVLDSWSDAEIIASVGAVRLVA